MTKIPASIKQILRSGGAGVIPTDTIYGLVGKALDKKAVARIYELRKRNPKKPFIILISSLADSAKFGVRPDSRTKKILKNFWPGKASVILSCKKKQFFYLHRGTKTLAFRLPKDKNLIGLLKATGPLAAPSANLEGKKPASTIAEAKKYFGHRVDFYLDAGKKTSRPSKLVDLQSGKAIILRK